MVRKAKPARLPNKTRAQEDADLAAAKAIRAKEHARAKSSAVPHVTTPAATFTVNTLSDTHLGTSTATTCVDTANVCSLRAAVEAANNLAQPVAIILPANTYTLTLGQLVVTNPAGTDIVGAGATKSILVGDSDRIVEVTSSSNTAQAGLLFISGSELTGGTSTDGGAIYLADESGGADAVLTSDLITGNTASDDGGAIYGDDTNTLYVINSTIFNNVATEGGAAYLYWGNGHFIDSTINNNTATDDAGGAFLTYYGDLSFQGGSLSGNIAGTTTTAGYGGAIYTDEYTDVEMNGTTVDSNQALDGGDGGAFYLSYLDMLDVTGGSISNNSAVGGNEGGAIYTEEGSQVGLHGVTLTNDTVTGTVTDEEGGGAIYEDAYYEPVQLTIDSGSTLTGDNASAIYIYGDYGGSDTLISDSTLSGNTNSAMNGFSASYGCGAAICDLMYESAGDTLTLTRDVVSNNTSAGGYGAGAVEMYTYEDGGSSMNLTSDVFSGNKATDNGYGGAVSMYNYDGSEYAHDSLRSTSNVFTNNTAGTPANAGAGGALLTYYYTTLIDSGSKFSGNQAIGTDAAGGAISNESEESSRYNGTTFTGNTAGAGTTGGYGGAVYLEEEAGDQLTGVTVSGNSASEYGGGIYSDGYQLGINRSTISGNLAGSSTAAGYGGGIYTDEGQPTQLNESTISGNAVYSIASTPGQGGGIYADSVLDSQYSTISGNFAQQGGGIYNDGYGGVVLDSIVSANEASSAGPAQDCWNHDPTTTPSSAGGNVLGAGCPTGIGDVPTDSPGLRALANNGGPTKTMGLTSASPAISLGTQFCDSTDQRGLARPSTKCSSGAYQRSAASISSLSPKKGKAGTKITIHGSGFTFLSKVTIGKRHAKILSATSTKIVVKAPKGPSGLKKKAKKVTVRAYSPDGYSKVGHFTYKKIVTKKKKKK